jgi:alcohol dehydrogenase class IV
MARGLPRVVAAPRDMEGRSDALYGAWLCGTVLGMVAMSLHHKLCHVLGGSFGLPHAETHAVVLPHATAYNAAHAPDAMVRIARALDATDAAMGLHDLAKRLGAPTALRDLGLREGDLDRAAEIASRDPYANPRPIERAGIRKLLGDAWAGTAPG